MKSIHVTAARTVVSLTALLAIVSVTPASGQGPGLRVTVQRNGQAISPAAVVFYAASDPKPGALAGNTASFDADVINASLEGKSATVYVDECVDGQVSVHLVPDDPGVQGPPGPNNCRRRPVGIVIIHRGSTITVDVARGTATGTSRAVSSNDGGSSGRRPGIGAFGNASGTWGGFNLGGATSEVIGGRFSAGNPPYQQYTVDVDDRASGLAFGGGLNLAFGNSTVGARVGFLRENERNVPEQSVDGSRVQGGLRFQQQGTSAVRSWTVYGGPTWTLPWGITVAGGPAVTFWVVELTQTGQLQAGCPTPCIVVIRDNNVERSSGSDLGFQVGADYYPGDGWLGLQFLYLLTTYRDAYDPSRPLAYPRDWRDSNVFVGAVVRMPRGR